jgi:hypothetical protein
MPREPPSVRSVIWRDAMAAKKKAKKTAKKTKTVTLAQVWRDVRKLSTEMQDLLLKELERMPHVSEALAKIKKKASRKRS